MIAVSDQGRYCMLYLQEQNKTKLTSTKFEIVLFKGILRTFANVVDPGQMPQNAQYTGIRVNVQTKSDTT